MNKKFNKYITYFIIANICFIQFLSTKTFAQEPIEILSQSAILMDSKTGNILYEYNCDKKLAPASLTKIMSLILIFENIEKGNLLEDELLTCSEYANSINGSQIWLDKGEEMSVKDLLKAVIISSANDATVVFAEKIAGSEQNFVNMMNERAKLMKLKSTQFKNCTGLDADNQFTTAKEVAIMACELLKHEKIFEYTKIWMTELRNGKTKLVNTNKLIRFYPGTNGLKTGTSDNAGCCLAASATRDELSLISVVMGAQNTEDRFHMSKMLLNYGFDNYVYVEPEDIQSKLHNLKVEKGEEEYVGLKANKPNKILVEKTKINNIVQEIKLPKKICAPILENQIIGTVTVTVNKNKMLEYPIIASKNVNKINFINAFKRLILNITNI